MVKICLLLIKNTLKINLHDINYCSNLTLPLFAHTNLAYVNVNIGIFIFINVALLKIWSSHLVPQFE